MKTILASLVVLGVSGITAQAEPLVLSDEQMEEVAGAGFSFGDLGVTLAPVLKVDPTIDPDLDVVVPTSLPINVDLATALAILAKDVTAQALSTIESGNSTTLVDAP